MFKHIEQLEKRQCLAIMGPSVPLNLPPQESIYLPIPIDIELKSLYEGYKDGGINAIEMKSLILSTKDNNYINRFEILQLNTYISNADMADHVRYLSNAVINGHETNDLFAGNSVDISIFSYNTVDILIDKWFNGKDLPKWYESDLNYEKVNGDLFVEGVSPSDAKQGIIGDCYFITALGAVAQNNPSVVENYFFEISDRLWVVRFYDNALVPHYVTVNDELPFDNNKNSMFAYYGKSDNTDGELWPALLEKAYVQAGQNRLIRNGNNSYHNINIGDSSRVILHMIGELPDRTKGATKQEHIDFLNNNTPIVISYNYHTYTFESYNPDTDKFFLRNPWGHSHIEETWEILIEREIVGDRMGGYVIDISAFNPIS